MENLKRKELPNFKKLPYTFDVEKIIKIYDGRPFDDLDIGYSAAGKGRPDLLELFPLSERKYSQLGFTKYGEGDKLKEENYNILNDWAKGTYIEEVINTFKAEVTRVRVARLEAHSEVEKHIDYDTDYSIRIHIPLITNDLCTSNWSRRGTEETVHMEEGSCWFFNQGWPHWIINDGDHYRDHLMLSLKTQEDL